mgnify:CR=1 FL=1
MNAILVRAQPLAALIKKNWLILLCTLITALFLIWGCSRVPFHPDESTQIYMSQDFRLLLTQPRTLAWQPGEDLLPPARYRAIDAPITRYLIGWARFLTRTPPLENDWNWSLSWAENASRGALPSSRQLLTSRFAVTLLIPASMLLLYSSVKSILNRPTASRSALLLGLNPLTMLHARRAMAESALLAGVCFFLWAVTRKRIRPWLIGLGLAAAVNAKQSAVALLPVGIIAVCWPHNGGLNTKSVIRRAAELAVVFTAVTLILNPFFWSHPFQAARVSLDLRSSFTSAQKADFLDTETDSINIGQRSLAAAVNLYLRQPSTEEVGNYLAAVEKQKQDYFSHPLHSWGRGLILGSLLLTLSAVGFLVLSLALRRSESAAFKGRLLLLLAFLLQLAVLILLFPLPWQRYMMPLLPFTSVLTSLGLPPLLSKIPGFPLISRPQTQQAGE